jgi:hypothetical protein
VLAVLGASACTSEAKLGYWTAPLGSGGSQAMPPASPMTDDVDTPDAAPIDTPTKNNVPDGGFRHLNPVCLRNPSLDGIPHSGPIAPRTWWPAEAWDLCFNDPEDFPDPNMRGTQLCGVTIVNDATTIDPQDGSGAVAGALPAPTHGVSYLQLDTLHDLPERTSQTMCGELHSGVTYNFAIDLASRIGQTHEGEILGNGVLEIYGGHIACNHAGEPLWRSPPLTAGWQTYCVSLTPAERISVLTLQVPAKDRARSAILIDNIRLSETCGPAVVE